eukprot:15171430-Alexandrium_andersonii.AAC.1
MQHVDRTLGPLVAKAGQRQEQHCFMQFAARCISCGPPAGECRPRTPSLLFARGGPPAPLDPRVLRIRCAPQAAMGVSR